MDSIMKNKKGLLVLAVGSLIQLFFGIIYVWSVFVEPVRVFYDWDVVSVKLTTSYMLSFFVVGILIGGKLLEKFTVSKVLLLGGLMLSIGMFATAFIPKDFVGLIYVTYGVVGGFGVGVGYNAIISSAQKWFPENRGFATGVSVCSFGFSTVIFAPLIEWLVYLMGIRHTFIVLSLVFFVVVLSLFSFIKFPDASGQVGAASAELLRKKQFTISEILRTKEFYFITLSLMLATAAFFIINPSIKTLAGERGLSPTLGTVVVMITGVSNALGRLCVPLISDKLGREKSALLIIVLTALGALSLCFVYGFLFVFMIACIAFCYGGFSGIYPVITADYFGIKNVGSNYGAVMVGFAISALVFPMVLSLIIQPVLKFIILAGMATVAAFLVTLLFPKK